MRNHILIIVAVGILMFLAGNHTATLFDNSEPHYAHVAKSMADSGNYLTLQFNQENWYVHPPLYFWATAFIGDTFGWTEFNLRFIEGVFGILGCILTYLLARRVFSGRVALYSALILGSSLYYMIISRLAIFDTPFNFFILLCIYFFFCAYDDPEAKGKYFLFYAISCGLAVMTKGPFGLLQPGMIIVPFLLYKRNLKFLWDLKVLGAFIVFMGLISPWYIHQLMTHGHAFFDLALRDYTWYRFFGVVEAQGGVWYYYFPILLTFFPWVFYSPLILRDAYFFKTIPFDPEERDFVVFSWISIAVTFVFFSLSGTKLPNYIFMIFPFVSILLAESFERTQIKKPSIVFPGLLVLFSFGLLIYAINTTIPYPYIQDRGLVITFFSIPLIFILLNLVSAFLKRFEAGFLSLLLGSLIFMTFLSQFFFPAYEKYKEGRYFVPHLTQLHSKYEIVSFNKFSPYLLYYLNHKVHFLYTIEDVEKLNQTSSSPVYVIIPTQKLDDLPVPFTKIDESFSKTLVRLERN